MFDSFVAKATSAIIVCALIGGSIRFVEWVAPEEATAQVVSVGGTCGPGKACSVASLSSSGAISGTTISGTTITGTLTNVADGTAGAPSVTFTDDLDTGFFRSASGETSYAANTTPIVRFNAQGLAFFPSSAYIYNENAAVLVNDSEGLVVGNGSGVDGDGPVSLGHATFFGIATGSLPSCTGGTNEGMIAYDTTTNKHVGCDGSAWNDLY